MFNIQIRVANAKKIKEGPAILLTTQMNKRIFAVSVWVSAAVGGLAFGKEASAQTNDSCTNNSSWCLYVDNSGTSPISGRFVTASGTAVSAQDTSTGAAVWAQTASGGNPIIGTQTGDLPTNSCGVWADGGGSDPGVYAVTTSSSASGVSGHNNSSTGGGNGVYGTASGTNGNGVEGNNSSSGNGVYGQSASTSSDTTTAGVTGYNSSTGFAGYFDGPVNITGKIEANGTCEFNCSSDIRMKQNVKPLMGAIDQLLQLKGVTFEWKSPADHDNHVGLQTGVIAQDVERVFPQWVGEDRKGFKTVDPDSRTVLALEVEAFRELKLKSDKQQAQIDKLQRQLDILANGKDPISGGPGFGRGMLGLFGFGFAGSIGLILARRKREDETASK
jgi:hypothetical protein